MRSIDESEIDSLLEICNDPIFSIDTNYIINNINFEAAELFEKGRNELLNKHINYVLPNEFYDRTVNVFNIILKDFNYKKFKIRIFEKNTICSVYPFYKDNNCLTRYSTASEKFLNNCLGLLLTCLW